MSFMALRRRRQSESPQDGSDCLKIDQDRRQARPNHSPSPRHREIQALPEDILADSNLYKIDERPFWKRKRFHFIGGVIVGVLAALGAATTTPVAQTHISELQAYLALQLADMDITSIMPTPDVVDGLFANVTNFFKPAPSTEVPFMPALSVAEELELKPHFPVVLIPGIISSGLESWGTSEKSQKYFRKRMWGTTTMFRSVLLDKESWAQHVKLDPVTGLDPPGVKIRAALGLDAADYFITGYWVWARIIENLAVIGYDSNSMYLASYDWRLSFSNLEVRDKYFTKLKSTIELYKATEGKKTVIIAHSMGSVVFQYFINWVESSEGGNGGPSWTEDHIETFVNIAGPMVGVPKALTAMLSGETRDTMALGSFGAYLLEKFFSRRERASLIRTWAGGSSMLPKGGEAIWGTNTWAPDDPVAAKDHHSFGNMISFTHDLTAQEGDADNDFKALLLRNHTSVSSLELLARSAPKEYNDQLRLNYSYGISTSPEELRKNKKDPRKWSNPLESPLPNAPSMKIYCFYGVGLRTERSYYYTATEDLMSEVCENQDPECIARQKHSDANDSITDNPTDAAAEKAAEMAESLGILMNNEMKTVNMFINPDIHDPLQGVETGVRFADGDGTVPLLSLGYMCTPSGGWTKHADLYNPAHIPVTLKEYQNEISESKLDVRGGRKAGDHVDILGNWEMTLDILHLVANKTNHVSQRILSDIERIANNIQL